MRDITLEDTIYPRFTTRAFATGIPTTLAGTPVLSIYEENNLTQITAGVSVSVDYDTVTGLNQATIVATAANGYETGKSYDLVITTGTVGGVSVVGEVVYSFTIESSAAAVDLANATDGLTALKAVLDTTGVLLNTTQGAITFGALTFSPVGNAANFDFNGAGSGDVFTFTRTGSGDLYDAAYKADLLAAIVSGGSVLGGANINQIMLDLADGGRLDLLIDAIKAVTDVIPDAGALTTLITHLTDIKGGTFSGATDSLEAIRDRGDAAWITGAGGSDRLLLADTTIATLATQTSFTLTAGSADDDAYNNCTIVVEDVATATQKAIGMVLDYTGATRTVTLKEALAFTIAATDKVYILAENSLKSTVANRQIDIDANGYVERVVLTDTTTTNTDMRGTDSAATEAKQDTMQTAIDTKPVATDIVSAGPITTSAGAVVNVDTVDTCATNTDMRGTDSAATETKQDATDIVIAELTAQGDTNESKIDLIDGVVDNLNLGIIYGTAATGTLSTTQATTNLTGYTDNQIIGAYIVVTSGAAEGERRAITDYTEIGGLIEFAAMTVAMANNDTFKIV